MDRKEKNIITFGGKEGAFGCFSNEYPADIELEGKLWPSVEHYYQAKKFYETDDEYMEEIRKAETVEEAKRLGNDRSKAYLIRKNYHGEKLDYVYKAIYQKFKAYPHMKKILLSTDPKYICQHDENDTVWGDGFDGSGKNLLGKLLMEVRSELKFEDSQK
jgi:ribA/ribD-fused uncharacterized protein